MRARLNGHKIVKRTAWRLAEVRRCAESCGSSEPRMHRRTIGNRDPVSIATSRADGPAVEGAANHDVRSGPQAVCVINQRENSALRVPRRRVGAAATDVLVFGGVCDRCGRPYLECRFPNGLCPSCFPGNWRAIEPTPSIAHPHLRGPSLAPA